MVKNRILYLLTGSFFIILLAFSILISITNTANSEIHTLSFTSASTGQTEDDISLKITHRNGLKNSWLKEYTKIENGKETVTRYVGITYDIILTNKTKFMLSDWKLKIPVTEKIYLNNAWCGTVEIQQFSNLYFQSQTLDLRKFISGKDKINLKHSINGGEIFIDLAPDDSITYHPSVYDLENQIMPSKEGNESYKIFGFIIYIKIDENTYKNPELLHFPEFDSAKLSYHLKLNVMQQNQFFLLILFFIVWIFMVSFLIYSSYKTGKLEKRNLQQKLHDNQIIQQTMLAFIKFIDAKDSITKNHATRVADYSAKIARAMGKTAEECEKVYYIGLMHDCGKISIPDAILNKPGQLNDDEYEIMKTHTTRGAEILNHFTSIPNIIEGAEYHHEHFDGSGYPKGLKGRDIPLIGRIICVADAFDAMNSQRSYKEKMPRDQIIHELKENSGTQFDPEIVNIFLELLEDGTIIF